MRRRFPAYEGNVTDLRTRTSDGVELSGVLVSQGAPGRIDAHDLAIVVSHGMTNHVHKPFVARLLGRLSRFRDVIALDLRGQGRSGGASSMGELEVLDVDAAVALARTLGYRAVASVGFSLGAAVAVRHAALHGGVSAVAAVSCPSRWWVRDTTAMRRVHWLVESPIGRVIAPGVGMRVGPVWGEDAPECPVQVVHRIPPTPLLIVHGTEDPYFPVEHGQVLARAAGPGAQLWIEQGMGHAENATTPELADRIGAWLVRNHVTGRVPSRDSGLSVPSVDFRVARDPMGSGRGADDGG